jgi:hypothetical protein
VVVELGTCLSQAQLHNLQELPRCASILLRAKHFEVTVVGHVGGPFRNQACDGRCKEGIKRVIAGMVKPRE